MGSISAELGVRTPKPESFYEFGSFSVPKVQEHCAASETNSWVRLQAYLTLLDCQTLFKWIAEQDWEWEVKQYYINRNLIGTNHYFLKEEGCGCWAITKQNNSAEQKPQEKKNLRKGNHEKKSSKCFLSRKLPAHQRKHGQPKGEKRSHALKWAQSPPKRKLCPFPTGVSHAQRVSQLFSCF